MALFSECMLQCAQKSLTPPTLSETRFFVNYEADSQFPSCRLAGTLQLEHARGTISTISRWTSSIRDLGHKPSPGHLPIAHDALRGNLQYFCRLLHAEPSEKSELDDLCFPCVDLR